MDDLDEAEIVEALYELKKPASITEIVDFVVERTGGTHEEVKPDVVITISKGVETGCIQRANRLYFIGTGDERYLDADDLMEPDPLLELEWSTAQSRENPTKPLKSKSAKQSRHMLKPTPSKFHQVISKTVKSIFSVFTGNTDMEQYSDVEEIQEEYI